MGLISAYKDFKEKRRQKAIEKNSELAKKAKAIREDRVAALEFFADLDDMEAAVKALLPRFDFSLEHGINDTREKELAMRGIVRFSNKAIPLIQEHLKETERIAWPIKCLKEIASEAEVIAILANCLDYGDVALDQHKTEKNFDILCYLRDYTLPSEYTAKFVHFLSQHDERVRYAAVEVLLRQNLGSVQDRIEPFIKDESAENTRIRQVIIQAFIDNKWTLQNKSEFAVGSLMPGVLVSKDFHLIEG